jgi:serine/threonine protein kinase
MTAIGNLARYRIISKLGSGGMATVDLAEDTLLGRRVALKRMSGEADVHGLTRLRREALVGASFSHANLVSVYDVLDTDDGHLVIVMEYIEGETLRQVLTRQGRLPVHDALPILAGVAAGLDAINERGIVHRDVKPSNILLGGGRAGVTVKLADLGIVSAPDRTRITSSGAVLGSLSYMAPEQLSDAPATRAVDVYALAAVTFEVLSGVKARREGNVVALAHAISTQDPPSLQSAWPEAPRGLDATLQRAMARDPLRRPRSAGELVARLRAALEPEATARPQTERLATPRLRASPASPPPRPPAPARPLLVFDEPARRRPRTGVVVAALLGLAVIAAAVVVALSSGSSPAPRPAAKAASTGRKRRPQTPAASRSSTAAVNTAKTANTANTASSPTTATSTTTASTTTTAAQSTPSSTSTPTASTAPATPTSAAADPVSAVESFYTLAAAHRYAAAWALADGSMRGQLGGYRSFQSGQAGDRSITFTSATIVNQTPSSARVAITTTSVRANGTQHCAGTVDLVPGAQSGQWQLHQIGINCS